MVPDLPWVCPSVLRFCLNVGRQSSQILEANEPKKAPPRRGLKEVVVLLSAGDFLTAVNKNWALGVGCSSVVLVVLLAAIGQGHGGSSKQAQVPVPWPESNCASPKTR